MCRSAHHDHPDSEYAARVFKHLRHLASELKQLGVHVVLVFVDDKCSAKTWEPSDAVAATERNKRVITNATMAAIASMHDFAKFKINPSVLLLADIPDDINLSFYRGQVYVFNFQPATPLGSYSMLGSIDKPKFYSFTLTDALTTMLSLSPFGRHTFLLFLIAARTCPQG